MKKWFLYIGLFPLCLTVACTEDEIPPRESLVLEAYLFADAPVDRVKVTRLGGFKEGSENVPVNNAIVNLFRNGQGFLLQTLPGKEGKYHYPGNDLTIDEGQRYEMAVIHQGDTLIGSTRVPPKPIILGSSGTVIKGTPSLPGPNAIGVEWLDNHNFWSPVIISLETDPAEIPRDDEFRFSFSTPSPDNSFTITSQNLTWYGQNAFITYSVNNEYVLLFDGNNPENFFETPSNIINGFGIFTAFNSDTLVFEVIP
jgi:hypothetical protein